MKTFTSLVIIGAHISAVYSTCTSFTPLISYSDIILNNTDLDVVAPSTRISSIVDCTTANTGGGNCNASYCDVSTVPYQTVRIDRILNLTVSEETGNQIFDLIRPSIPGEVVTRASWVYSTGGGMTSGCFEPGTSAWWEFMSMYSCITGTLSECSGDDIANGTLILGCGIPVRSGQINETLPLVWGYLSVARGPSGMTAGPPANATIAGEQAAELNGALGKSNIARSSSILAGAVAVLAGSGLMF